jgi:hypothetical protein
VKCKRGIITISEIIVSLSPPPIYKIFPHFSNLFNRSAANRTLYLVNGVQSPECKQHALVSLHILNISELGCERQRGFNATCAAANEKDEKLIIRKSDSVM